MKEKRKHTIYWIVGIIIILAVTTIITLSFTLQMITGWLIATGELFVALVIIYFFWSDLMFGAIFILHKGKKCICCICTIITLILCIFVYKVANKPPESTQMEENKVYIPPKSKANIFNADSIFNGSKNDPNLNQVVEGTVRMQEDMLYKLPKKDTTRKNINKK